MQTLTQQARARSPALLAAFIPLCVGPVLGSVSRGRCALRSPGSSPLVLHLMVGTRPLWIADRGETGVSPFKQHSAVGRCCLGLAPRSKFAALK